MRSQRLQFAFLTDPIKHFVGFSCPEKKEKPHAFCIISCADDITSSPMRQAIHFFFEFLKLRAIQPSVCRTR